MSQRGYIRRWRLDESGVIKQRRTEGRKNERSERQKKSSEWGENGQRRAEELGERDRCVCESGRHEGRYGDREVAFSIFCSSTSLVVKWTTITQRNNSTKTNHFQALASPPNPPDQQRPSPPGANASTLIPATAEHPQRV